MRQVSSSASQGHRSRAQLPQQPQTGKKSSVVWQLCHHRRRLEPSLSAITFASSPRWVDTSGCDPMVSIRWWVASREVRAIHFCRSRMTSLCMRLIVNSSKKLSSRISAWGSPLSKLTPSTLPIRWFSAHSTPAKLCGEMLARRSILLTASRSSLEAGARFSFRGAIARNLAHRVAPMIRARLTFSSRSHVCRQTSRWISRRILSIAY